MFSCLFQSVDLDHCRAEVGRVFKPHRLDLLGRGQTLQARMDHLAHGALSLSRLRYGADVAITPGPLGDFYLLQMPLTGAARIVVDGVAFDSRPGIASLLSPQPDLAMRWSGANDQLILRIGAERLRMLAAQWTGDDAATLPLPVFTARAMITAASPLLAVLQDAFERRARLGARLDTPAITEPLEHLVAGLLLHGQPNSLSARLAGPAPLPPARIVADTEAYLAAHPDAAHSAGSLAARHRVSVRALFLAFQRDRGYGPMQFLRECRLLQARRALEAGAADVSRVALDCGFGHFGRFSAVYAHRFGERPSETRRRMLPRPVRLAAGGRRSCSSAPTR
ncbi:MAG: AraC family transcriptional regulator [Lautropia sp.]